MLGAIAALGVAALAYVALRPAEPVVTPPSDPSNLAQSGPAQPYQIGADTAPVRIEEFSDFECPSCARFAAITEPDVRTRLVQTGRARFIYYDFPLPQHRNSYPASHAAACADEQGKFWEMHDRIFDGQDRWATHATSNPKGLFRDMARAIGADVARWEACYDSRKYQARIDANNAEGIKRGVNSTPTFFINGRPYRGSMSYDEMRAAVDAAAAGAATDTGAAR